MNMTKIVIKILQGKAATQSTYIRLLYTPFVNFL